MSERDVILGKVKAVLEAAVGQPFDEDPEAFIQAAAETAGDTLKTLVQAAAGGDAGVEAARDALSGLRARTAEAGFDPGEAFEALGDRVHAAGHSPELAEVLARGAEALRGGAEDSTSAGARIAEGLAGFAERLDSLARSVAPEPPEAPSAPPEGGPEST